ncbi:hypothetical protein D3X48_18885, partial [Acinetobacter baumannii]
LLPNPIKIVEQNFYINLQSLVNGNSHNGTEFFEEEDYSESLLKSPVKTELTIYVTQKILSF